MRIPKSMAELTGWKAVVAAIFIVSMVGLRVASRMNRGRNEVAPTTNTQSASTTPPRPQRGEDFTIDGVITIPTAAGFTWQKRDEGEADGVRYEEYFASSKDDTSAVIIMIQQRTARDDSDRQKLLKAYRDGFVNTLGKMGLANVQGELAEVESPVPDRIQFALTGTRSDGVPTEIRSAVIFGSNNFYNYVVFSKISDHADSLLAFAADIKEFERVSANGQPTADIAASTADANSEAASPTELPPADRQPEVAATRPATPVPARVEPTEKPLTTDPSIRVGRFEVDAKKLLWHLVWSNDGMHLYTLTREGLLQRFSLPDRRESQRAQLEGSYKYLGLSRQGIVVAREDTKQIVLLDLEQLQVRHEVEVDDVTYISCAPPSSIVYVGTSRKLQAVDLRGGPAYYPDISPSTRLGADFRGLRLSQDGATLFSGTRTIHRSKTDGTRVVVEDVGAKIGNGSPGVAVSMDGQFVALPTGGGNKAEGLPQVGYGTYVFAAKDLQSPVLALSTGNYPRTIAFDPATKDIYAQNYDKHLIVISESGETLNEYVFENVARSLQFLVHPRGRRLCVLSESDLLWVELSGADETALEPLPDLLAANPEPERSSVASSAQPDVAATNSATKPVLPAADVAPEKMGPPLAGDIRETKVEVDGAALVDSLAWSRDGNRLVTLTKDGVLQTFSVPEMRPLRKNDLSASCSFVGQSKAGLVVLTDKQLLVLDDSTLRTRREIRMSGVLQVTCAPASATAYATSASAIACVDLARGKIERVQLEEAELTQRVSRSINSFRFMRLSPDGRYLFSGVGMLQRGRVRGPSIILEESSTRIASATADIVISDDSQLVAMPSGGGNRGIGPDMRNAAYIFSVSDLATPRLTVSTGPKALAFDTAAQKIYGAVDGKQLVVFTMDGLKQAELSLGSKRGTAKRILVHPKGHRLCVLTDSELIWVELPGAESGAVAPSETPTESSQVAEFRTWSDKTGKFKVVAKLVEVRDGVIVLEKRDGTTAEVPLDRLSEQDQQFAHEAAAAN